MGEVRDAIEGARVSQDTAELFRLTKERDDLRETLANLQRPSRAQLVKDLETAEAQLEGLGFKPPSGMLRGMTGGGGDGLTVVSGDGIAAARQAQQQNVSDSGVQQLRGRIAMLKEQLAKA